MTYRWQPLRRFADRSVPKLHNLHRAARAGLPVPQTWWMPAADAVRWEAPTPPPKIANGALMIRSGSPTEDTRETSNAGQLLSLGVERGEEFAAALRQVAAALARDAAGEPSGVVFVQPRIEAAEAGVAFFDGFYYERSAAAGGNAALTGGESRGDVVRGHLERADPWSAWLERIDNVFGGQAPDRDPRLDIEWARTYDGGYVLLQVRPALFPVLRNETLSLANHREILGDPPSPWIVSVLEEAGRRAIGFYAAADPEIERWDEAYAVTLAERAWMNFSFFFRLMDRWGLPRAFVTEGVGGSTERPADRHLLPRRFVRAIPRLLRLQIDSLRTMRKIPAELERIGAAIQSADGLPALHEAGAAALALVLRANFAINGSLTGAIRVRRALRIPGKARVVTEEMMREYSALATLPTAEARRQGLDDWLSRYGHRGPLESDPAKPRFAELRAPLLADIERLVGGTAGGEAPARTRTPTLLRPLFRLDETREAFRDATMRHWQTLRQRLLAEGERLVRAGELDAADDVFLLRAADLGGEAPLRDAVVAARQRLAEAAALALPSTAPRLEIKRAAASAPPQADDARTVFPGIPLGAAVVEGRAVVAEDLMALLSSGEPLGPDTILVTPALEPSWAVVFGRVGGVVAQIGGELSHAAILLREAGRPAIVNCAGILAHVRTGDRLRIDGRRGVVERLNK